MAGGAAAIWSAIAASFSAFAAISIWRIQRSNQLDATRPDIILSGWERKKVPDNDAKLDCEYLCFKSIRNIGKGTALRVFVNSYRTHENRPQSVLNLTTIPVLAAGEEQEINGEILIFWENVPETHGVRWCPIEIEILSWCFRNYRHKTSYRLSVPDSEDKVVTAGLPEIAPGVIMLTRNASCRPVWWLKLSSKLSNIPGIKMGRWDAL